MKLTPDEETQAIATLHQCGIDGDDAHTALTHVCTVAGNTSFLEWLNNVRAATPTDQSLDDALREYGSNQIRSIRALATHYPVLSGI